MPLTIEQLCPLGQQEIKSIVQRRDEEIPKTEEYEKIKSKTLDELTVGEKVLVKHHKSGRWDTEATIIKKREDRDYPTSSKMITDRHSSEEKDYSNQHPNVPHPTEYSKVTKKTKRKRKKHKQAKKAGAHYVPEEQHANKQGQQHPALQEIQRREDGELEVIADGEKLRRVFFFFFC